MQTKIWIILFLCAIAFNSCAAYKMTRCQLVTELRKHGFPEDQMKDWVCLVENESSRRTDVVSKPNRNGSKDYGLFQINNTWWCSNTTTPGRMCDVTCADLITDDITKAAECANIIYKKQGFLAWHGWEKRCQKPLDLPTCLDHRVLLMVGLK